MRTWALRIKMLTHNILKITDQGLPIALGTSKNFIDSQTKNNQIHREIISTDDANHFINVILYPLTTLKDRYYYIYIISEKKWRHTGVKYIIAAKQLRAK